MESYDSGVIVGKILFWLILFGFGWGIYRLWKSIFSNIFSNSTKKELQKYLFWVDFVQGITTTDEFKKRLSKIKNKTVYKDEFNRFYLTLGEATAQNKKVEAISIKEILKSNTYPLFLLKRVESITLYSKDDLKNITKNSQIVWIIIKDICIHMILKQDSFIYPVDYPQDNKFRFGYSVLHDKNGLMGVYDIDKDKLILPFEYKYIKTFGNIIILSQDNKIYYTYDLSKNEIISETKNAISLDTSLKEKIDLNKIELKNYIELFDTLKSQKDLERIGLWGAKVGVMQIPSAYEDIIEDSSTGSIEWQYPVSADIYDMNVELPVKFIKKDGTTVCLGIDPEYLIIEDREILKQIDGLFTQGNNITNTVFEVWIDDSEDCMGNSRYVDDYDPSIHIDTFTTEKEATEFIEKKIDSVLRKMKIEVNSIEELKIMDIPENVSYFIKIDHKGKIFFKTWEYIQNNAKRIFEEKENINNFKDLLKRGNLPDDRPVPIWLQIKNDTYKTIPTTKEIIADIVCLDDDEFMVYINKTINQNVFFTALSQAKDDELEIFYKFLEKGQEKLSQEFEKKIEDFKNKNIEKEQLNFSLMVVSLYPKEAKKTNLILLKLHNDMNRSNFSKEDEMLFDLEYSMNSLLFHATDDLNIKLKEFISLIKEQYEKEKLSDDFCKHIASKFFPLLVSIDKSHKSECTKLEFDLKWFIENFIKEDMDILQDVSILHQLILLHHLRIDSILEEKPNEYLDHTITIARYLMAFYPYLKQSGLIYLDDIMNFVAHKDISVENANDFIELFELLPAFYADTSYENIIEFKEFVNKRIGTWKPQDNKIFGQKGVKNKIVLLNYLVNIEDLYYKSSKDKKDESKS